MESTTILIENRKINFPIKDSISAMLAYWDKNLICRYANSAYHDWFGRTAEEMIDKMTAKELLGPLYEKNLPFIQSALQGNKSTFEREIITPTGEHRFSIANYYPDIVNGEVRGFVAHVADITSVKQMETKLAESNEIINKQNKQLLNFANVVSHNLRNYSNNLKLALNIYITSSSPKEKFEMLNMLKEISEEFGSTLNNLTEITKVANLGKTVLESVNIFECTEHVLKILRLEIKTNNAVIKNSLNPHLTLAGNASYLESIMLNLIGNAIKYRDINRHPLIEVSAVYGEHELELKISDNGIGIDLNKYGDELFGIYKTFHVNPDATGIGLYITKYQIESLGGYISVESTVGKGTTFKLTFKTD